eukprot:GILJ01005105.1.p1 GENE.GILJ01005105.1~~GILJ01005105.1.p1  ORF type:complete len:220 (-),score=36.94 GILJ01005105.1:709-1341(-)
MVVRHVVAFQFKAEATSADKDRLYQYFRGIPQQIPSVRSYIAGEDLKVIEPAVDFTINASFDTKEDWSAYQTHDAHMRLVTEAARPVAAKRVAFQFESESVDRPVPSANYRLAVLVKVTAGAEDAAVAHAAHALAEHFKTTSAVSVCCGPDMKLNPVNHSFGGIVDFASLDDFQGSLAMKDFRDVIKQQAGIVVEEILSIVFELRPENTL